MKYLTLASICAGLLFTSQSMAQQYQFIAMDKSLETELCVNVGNNDAKAVKRNLRELGTKERKRHINAIRCNDLSTAKFAYKYQAEDTFEFLNKHSFGANKVRKPTVTIKDMAKSQTKPKIIYVSSGS